MSRKYELISELYDRTCKTVVSNPQNWQNFLQSACRNYKLRYDEQLLIYAQRPDATAVLEIERWNKSFGRWVNKGARGIAVFADENRKTYPLLRYFRYPREQIFPSCSTLGYEGRIHRRCY